MALSKLMAMTYPWEDWQTAFEDMAHHRIGKAVMVL